MTAPGWYPDNASPHLVRWFDGRGWTEHTAPVPGAVLYAPAYPAPGVVGQSPTYAGQPTDAYPGQPMSYGGFPTPRPSADVLGPGEVAHWLVPVGRSWQSITAGYVGLVSLLIWPLGPVAIWLGVLGLRAARTGGHGSGRSIFAIVTGAVGTLLLVFALIGFASS